MVLSGLLQLHAGVADPGEAAGTESGAPVRTRKAARLESGTHKLVWAVHGNLILFGNRISKKILKRISELPLEEV